MQRRERAPRVRANRPRGANRPRAPRYGALVAASKGSAEATDRNAARLGPRAGAVTDPWSGERSVRANWQEPPAERRPVPIGGRVGASQGGGGSHESENRRVDA